MIRHPVVAEDLARIAAAPIDWGQLRGKTVLISGAAGFLPAYMVETLLFLNESDPDFRVRVVGLVRNLDRARVRFDAYAGRGDLHLIEQDVSAPLELDERCEVIVHAAGQASPRFYDTDPVGTIDSAVLGTRSLLERARRDDSETVLVFSSGEVYGETQTVPTTEDDYGPLDPTRVRSCYGESKRLAETLCVAYRHQYGVPVKLVRPYHTYGPGLRLDDGRVFADFVADVIARRPLLLKSDGLATRAFCYLADATLGFFTVLLAGESARAYNIGNDQAELSILELARTLGDEFGLEVVEQPGAASPGYVPSTIGRSAPDIGRARALGWAPTTSVRDGFARTVRSFQAVA